MDKKRGINKRFHPKINSNQQTLSVSKGNNQQQQKNIIKSEEKIMLTKQSPLDQLDNFEQTKPNESIDASGILQKIESNTDLNWNFKRENDNKINTNLISDEEIKISIKVNKPPENIFSERSNNDIVITENTEEGNEKKKEENVRKNTDCCDKFCIFRVLLIIGLSIFLFFFILWNMNR